MSIERLHSGTERRRLTDISSTHVAAMLIFLAAALPGSAAEVLIEAESFADRGGWSIDPQFAHVMGSPYLLAHGLGEPVGRATTSVEFPQTGTYFLWVRTKDWAAPHRPGRFRVLVEGEPVDVTFGTGGPAWSWQRGGTVEIGDKEVSLALEDLTGFDGRCDALYFTTDENLTPPNQPGNAMAAWRKKLLGLPATPPSAGRFDLVVVGGGVAGCSAALTAARLGLDVALIQDRPVLGGNASDEIRIHPVGFDRTIVAEVASPNRRAVIEAEKRIHLYLSWQAFGVEKHESRIAAVDAKHTSSGKELRFEAPLFVDSTGDGWIGYWAGADFRMGRESREEYGESMAPPKADKMTHGSTLYFKVDLADAPTTFPEVPWAQEVSKKHVDLRSDHSWEYGHRLNMIDDAERIRDHLLLGIYGTFATAKKKFATAARHARLARVDYIAARGESRRLMGDHILTENEIKSKHAFPDGVARGGVVFCLHYPGEEHDFRSQLKLTAVEPYLIPFRSLYSRNVENLMMAGRDASASHIAYSSIKLMKTGGQMGVAVGAAAMLAKKYDVGPRGVYERHIEELKDVVFERAPYENALKPKGDRPADH